ncbi:hypothetical protein EON80_09345 [bacterium]|nr:MAG: hypothetical protein EON80_09345 [bacterium]
MRKVFPLAALLLATAACAQQPQELPAPVLVANIQDKEIKEGSGLAASRRYPGLLYIHNDSGDTARVFAVNEKGETVATISFKGIYARDWEDMTFAGDYLYVGDIGDNLIIRDAVQIYRFKEPELDPLKLGQTIEIEPETLAVRPIGTPRNAETLLAAPDGRVWIVSKDEGGSWVFEAQFEAGKTVTFKKVGEKLNFGATGMLTKLATGGDFSSDGTRLAIVTYAQLYEWKLPAPYDIANLSKITPQIRALPNLKQCESVCYSADGTRIFVSSEGKSAPIYSVTPSH